MKRVSVLLIASVLSLSYIQGGVVPKGFPSRLDHDMQLADLEMAKIHERHGLPVYRNHAREIMH